MDMQNLDISQFSERSAVNHLDRLLLVTTEGNDGSIKVSLIITQIESDIKPSINASGMWLVGEVETGVQAIGKTPQLKQDPLGILWKYDTEIEWKLLVPWSSIKFTFDELTEAQKDELTPKLEDFSPEEIVELQRPATEMIAILQATNESVNAAESLRVEAENQRTGSEGTRVEAEALRVEAETVRAAEETLRSENEKKRSEAELLRVQNESLRIQAEQERESNESERNGNEASRLSEEDARIKNEKERVSAESARKSSESERVSAELERNSSESSRKSAESLRASSEQSRNEAETIRKNAENARISAETARIENEDERIKAESIRKSNETNRANAESERAGNEADRIKAESLRATSESERSESELMRIDNEDVRKLSEEERESNENVRKNNEQERLSAESSRVAADSDRKNDYAVLREDIVSATKAAWGASAEVRNIPVIKDGTWWTWDVDNDTYKDTGSPATSRSPQILNGTWWVWDDVNSVYSDTGQSVSADYKLTKEKIEGVFNGNIESHWHDRYVEKVEGKDLSTEDFTTEEKQKLASLENFDPTDVYENIKAIEDSMPTKVSELENDAQYVTSFLLDERSYATTEQLSFKQDKNLYYTNISASEWILENVYKDYKYRCNIVLDVTANMVAEVIFGIEEASSGDYSPLCETGDGVVTIWSATNKAIVIPTIIINK